MWVLLVLAFAGMFLIVERILFFQRIRIKAGDFIMGVANYVRKDKHGEALHEAGRTRGPVARVAHAVLMRHHLPRTDLRDIAQEAGQLELPHIEKSMRGLYAIVLLAPMVGMVGTISGLIEAFKGSNGSSTSSMIEGVYESLVSSGIGMILAVLSYLFYLHFLGRAKRLVHRIERAGIEIVNIICDTRDGIYFEPKLDESTGADQKPVAEDTSKEKLEKSSKKEKK